MGQLSSVRASRFGGHPFPVQGAGLDSLLVAGGDERIALDPVTGLNKYGCGVAPEREGLAFSSSTASTISPGALRAAADRFEHILGYPDPRAAHAAEAEGLRRRLARLCGLEPQAAEDIVLAASGTDIHLIAADLARGDGVAPLVAVMPSPTESGRGVPLALRGVGYSSSTPHGGGAVVGEPIDHAVAGVLLPAPVRDEYGAPRPAEAVDRDVARACDLAVRRGGRVLLVLLDVSKTGLVAPTPACAAALKARHGEALTVLVDACQFRISAQSLRRYLDEDFLVAVTGSKFLGGPAFSGALFIPPASVARLRGRTLSRALADYCGRGDWPASWTGRALLPDLANLGLLLRWEAALHELAAFRALPDAAVAGFLADFGRAMDARLLEDPAFEPLSAPSAPRLAPDGWDAMGTIFPFLVHRGGQALDAPAVQALYEAMRAPALHRPSVRLGQPVAVGARAGVPVSALRLSLCAGHVVEALTTPGGADAVIARAGLALDLVAGQARGDR